MSDYGALAVITLIASFFVYAIAPPRWQTPLGFAIIACMMPAGFIALGLLARPEFLIPAALFFGILIAGRAS